MPAVDLFVFRTMEEANLRYPRHARRAGDRVTSACAVGRSGRNLPGLRPSNVYLYAPISAEAERMLRAGQLGLQGTGYYGAQDEKPPHPGIQ
jgi:hypothetical protein